MLKIASVNVKRICLFSLITSSLLIGNCTNNPVNISAENEESEKTAWGYNSPENAKKNVSKYFGSRSQYGVYVYDGHFSGKSKAFGKNGWAFQQIREYNLNNYGLGNNISSLLVHWCRAILFRNTGCTGEYIVINSTKGTTAIDMLYGEYHYKKWNNKVQSLQYVWLN